MTNRSPGHIQRVDALYDDPALVSLYDILNGADHDRVFYRAEIGDQAKYIVDLGCGTGRFAIDMAERGYKVIGVDPAPTMIDFAKNQKGGAAVDWRVGTAADISAVEETDAVVMMGHAFQCLLTDEAVEETCAAVRSALRDGGRFLFESRNPRQAPWTNWNNREEITPEGSDSSIAIDRKVLAVAGDLVSFEETFFLPTNTVTSRSTLRFLDKETIIRHLRSAGFTDITVFGFWDRRPYSDDSPEIIISAA